MPSYTCDPALELTGCGTERLFATVDRDQLMPFLEVYDLVEIDSRGWVRLCDVLNVMNALAWLGGPTGDFIAIGLMFAERGELPAETVDAGRVAFWRAIAAEYQHCHRNGDPGAIRAESVADRHLLIRFDGVPYPDDILYGMVFGYAQRTFAGTVRFSVAYDQDVLTREQGGQSTLIHLLWE